MQREKTTLSRFNTASGRYCYFITFVFPSFGQGLEMCGPHRRFAPLLPRTLRRIPQAVSTVATPSNVEVLEAAYKMFQYRKR